MAKAIIQATNLGYRYPGSARPAIEGLGFAVQSGEIFGFLGPSGAGKSTTQRVLIRLARGYSGTVEVFGRDLREWDEQYFERVGVAFELPNHFMRLSARRNLEYFGALYQSATLPAGDLLAMLGLAADADTPVAQFSKGMQTRLSIARALLHQPQLLFLDEPTSGLDPVNAQTVKEIIRRQRDAGCTVVLTTHNMSLADELCDRVALIVDGHIAVIDEPRALKLRYGTPQVQIEHLHDGQLRKSEFPLAGLAGNDGFLQVLRGNGVQTIHSREASLEDVFLAVTGQHLAAAH
ncbi:MAG TPA: ABC transporter ATP-binding protein [Roseiflexaceae bacterium]|nr:ABC transporter ATP-binding protein [Roseiflexaceae bacterium]